MNERTCPTCSQPTRGLEGLVQARIASRPDSGPAQARHIGDLERQLAEAQEEVERLRGEQREWQELADTAVDVHDTWKTRFIEMREKIEAVRHWRQCERHHRTLYELDFILGEKEA